VHVCLTTHLLTAVAEYYFDKNKELREKDEQMERICHDNNEIKKVTIFITINHLPIGIRALTNWRACLEFRGRVLRQICHH
jgi:hypothetical protein